MRLVVIVLCITWAVSCSAQTAEPCGQLSGPGQYGPYDYRTDKDKLPIVEINHFDSSVENLIRGKTGPLGGDIDYTLRAFPNHHRALNAMMRLTLGNPQPQGANFTVSCYFDRAVRFRPDDGVVRMLYANYLAREGKPTEALAQMQAAEKLLVENANLHYNMGLVYMTLKDYDKALYHAHRAYGLGWQLPGLRNMLQKAGKWREPQKEESATIEAPAKATTVDAPAIPAEPQSKP